MAASRFCFDNSQRGDSVISPVQGIDVPTQKGTATMIIMAGMSWTATGTM
jgi:hypothetical protein